LHVDTIIRSSSAETPASAEAAGIPDTRPDLYVPSLQQDYNRSHENAAFQSGPSRKQGHGPRTGRWSDAALKSAIAVVEVGGKLKIVSRYFDIPSSSLSDHLYGRTLGRKRGPPTILKQEEESVLTTYMAQMQDCGHLLSL
jgi:hypothetical protein